MYANVNISINIIFSFMFNIYLVNMQQLPKAMAQFSFKNVLKFLHSVSIKVFISITAASPDEGNFGADRIRNSRAQFFFVPY